MYLTPSDVHYGRAEELLQRRHQVLLRAYHEHPERFPRGVPRLPSIPAAVWINPPDATDAARPIGACDKPRATKSTVMVTGEAGPLLGLSEWEQRYVLEHLVAAAYLERALQKAPDARARDRLRDKAAEVRSRPADSLSPATSEALSRWTKLSGVVGECVALFQRSSSCVEGRNGQLALRHHSLHTLSAERLRALTVVHNYFLRRADGTTAAERFFGTTPPGLFQWLLDRLDVPARPARKRRTARNDMPKAA